MGKNNVSNDGINPSMENPKREGGGLIRVDIAGIGEKWVDPKTIKGMDYDPEVIRMGGSEYFKRFIFRSLYAHGLGLSPENNIEWDVMTHNKYWCDPNDVKNFPLMEPGPGRIQVPVYLFVIQKIRGKAFLWGCYAVVEEVLRGTLSRYEDVWIKDYGRQIQTGILDKLKAQEDGNIDRCLPVENKQKKHYVALNPFIEKLKQKGLKDIRVTEDGQVQAMVPLNQMQETPYDPEIIKEGGLESFTKFIRRCLELKGLGTAPENEYEWEAKSMMSWFDPNHQDKFPIFEKGPGMFEEPVYVFTITKLGGKPFQWLVAAEVEDILRGCHVKYENYWIEDHLKYIQIGILDRLDKPDSPPWAGGFSGSVNLIPKF